MVGARMSRLSRFLLVGLCVLMGGSGMLHFVAPAPYRGIVPGPLRAQAALIVALSGVCELVCAILLAVPRTRRLGALATAALLVAVFPANVQMALDGGLAGKSFPLGSPVVAWLRLPLQVPLVAWARAVALRSRPQHPVRRSV